MSRLWKAHRGPSEALLFFLSVWLLYLPIALSTCTSTLPRCQVNFVFPLTCRLCLAVLVCTSEFWALCINIFIYLFLVFHLLLLLSLHIHTNRQTHTHSLTQLISPSHAHSSSRMWPCLIVYHAHLFSLRDVTIAYLFSSGLPSHIKMIDSFHSLHIFKLYLISSFPLAFKFLLFPCLKVIMLPRHVIIHSRDCFFS